MYDTITDVPGIQVGHYTDPVAVTGCTVVLCPEGAVGGVDVRGAAPGTRETDLLRPLNLVQQAHAVVLSGGSAYGLAAADGVMTFLEERGIGFPVGVGVVPIVASAILFDLAIGDPTSPPPPRERLPGLRLRRLHRPCPGLRGCRHRRDRRQGPRPRPCREGRPRLLQPTGWRLRRRGPRRSQRAWQHRRRRDRTPGRRPPRQRWPRLPGQRRSIGERGCPGRGLGPPQHNPGRRRHRRPPHQGAGQQGRPDGP